MFKFNAILVGYKKCKFQYSERNILKKEVLINSVITELITINKINTLDMA